jgi:GTP-binding protein YchF
MGIVGLPNVGKSTLFNALTQTAAAQAANYPFCTIEPNVGDVAVPDPRLDALAEIAGSAQIIPTRLTFVDIAGLVRGASRGEGLGNQFLANIREVDAIAHVVRCFEDSDVTHVEGKIEPVADIETIETELMLADLDSLEKRVVALEKKAKGGDKEAKETLALVNRSLALLREGKPARLIERKPEEERLFQTLGLLTSKPVLYVCNVEEASADKGNAFSAQVFARAAEEGARAVVVSAKIESEIAVLPPDEQEDYLEAVGLSEPGLNRVIRAGYDLLGLLTYFTVGPKEARAWTIPQGTRAPQAAGVIHTDFEKGFIRAETIAYPDYVSLKGEAGARDAGRLRLEGKEYAVQDGDVLHFRFAT